MKAAIHYGGLTCEPGKKVQGMVEIGDTGIKMPITLVNGDRPGKTAIVCTGLHGGEYPSIGGVIELAQELTPDKISGQIVVFHPVNVEGFLKRVPYINPTTGTNLNRKWPGRLDGDLGEKVAYYITRDYIDRCDYFIDTHGGDLHEYQPNYIHNPGFGDDNVLEESLQMALVVDVPYLVPSRSKDGAYNCAAIRGVPSILMERGCRGIWTREEIDAYKKDLKNVLRYIHVLDGAVEMPKNPAQILVKGKYINSNSTGCWYPAVDMEAFVKQGQLLGQVKDFFGNVLEEIRAENDGVIIMLASSLAIVSGDPIVTYAQLPN